MAVVGVDIGDYSTHIAVARLGAVEIIDNDYSLRATPSVVAYGERQRFVGVAAENQRNLNPRHTVSHFKNTVGMKYSTLDSLEADRFGAKAVIDSAGKVSFQVKGGDKDDDAMMTPEQVLATLFTKVKDIVKAAEGSGTEGNIETLVVSVPIYFTQAQRQAVKDAATIAGLTVNEIVSDMSALALTYGKSKDLAAEEKRHVIIVDVGSEGMQAVVAEFDQQSARVLASASNNHVGGRLFDQILVNHAIRVIEEKYKLDIKSNMKARNRIKNAMEKTKKQMSANTNKIPVQIDSLVDDTDVQFSIDRTEFEQLIKAELNAVRDTLKDLLDSTTLKKEDLTSVEIVGGSARIPAIKQIIQEETGLAPSTTMNADEAVARGCALTAASLSSKFITKKYDIVPAVHYGVEAMFVHGGEHSKVLVCDKGDSIITGEPLSFDITADLPLNIALQYTEANQVEDKFVALYKVDTTEAKKGNFSVKFEYTADGILELAEVVLTAEEQLQQRKRKKSADSAEDSEEQTETEMSPCRTQLAFTKSMPEPLNINRLREEEARMLEADLTEIQRQEQKNSLEELLFKCRHQVEEHSEELGEEEVYTNIIAYFDETENWLYEEGEGAPQSSYLNVAETLQKKMQVFSVWVDKYQQMKAREEEKKRFMEQQQQRQQQQQHPQYEDDFFNHSAARHFHNNRPERQIPVVFEGDRDEYIPKQHPHHHFLHPQHQQQQRGSSGSPHRQQQRHSPTRFANRPDPFFHGSPFFGDSLFGW